MKRALKMLLAGLGALAALGLASCGDSQQVRVYVDPTYEQGRLQELLARYPDVQLVYPGTEDVTLHVEALPDAPTEPRVRRAALRARHRDGHEVYAVAEFLRVRNDHGGRARWASSYAEGVREDDVSDILIEVVREAAWHQHPGRQRSLAELLAAVHTTSPADN